MTVAELIIELKKLDQSVEVWADTDTGLYPVDMVYVDSDTAVLSLTNEFGTNTQGYN